MKMLTVYILRSVKYPGRLYIGSTTDISKRLKEHNSCTSTYTKQYGPWELETYTAFKQKGIAENFEKYLKSGSGFAFLKKRLLPQVQ